MFETALRVTGGDVRQRVYAIVDPEGLAIVEVENDSPQPVAVAFSMRGTRPFGRLRSPGAGSRGPGRRSRRRSRLPDPSPGGGAGRGAPARERSNVARSACRPRRKCRPDGVSSRSVANGSRRPVAWRARFSLARAQLLLSESVEPDALLLATGSAMAARASDRRPACRGDRPRRATCGRSSALGAGPARVRRARRSAAPPRRGRGAPGIGRRRARARSAARATLRCRGRRRSRARRGRTIVPRVALSGLASDRSSCSANGRRSGSARASLPIRSRRAGARSRSRSVGTASVRRCSGNARRR